MYNNHVTVLAIIASNSSNKSNSSNNSNNSNAVASRINSRQSMKISGVLQPDWPKLKRKYSEIGRIRLSRLFEYRIQTGNRFVSTLSLEYFGTRKQVGL